MGSTFPCAARRLGRDDDRVLAGLTKRCVLKFGGVAAKPPAGVVAAVGEEGSCAGLVGGALLVGLDAVVLERREQELAYLHAIVTAAVPYADAPDGPVADP